MKQNLNDFSPGMNPLRLDFENEDCDIVTIGLTENGTYVLANKITKDDIDEMIFIMDNQTLLKGHTMKLHKSTFIFQEVTRLRTDARN